MLSGLRRLGGACHPRPRRRCPAQHPSSRGHARHEEHLRRARAAFRKPPRLDGFQADCIGYPFGLNHAAGGLMLGGQASLSLGFLTMGGTAICGVSVGRFRCHCVAFSYAFARARTFPSENRGPAIIRPMGKPLAENPQGTEIAGRPKMLNGEQFEIKSGALGLLSSSRSSESPMVRGSMRMVGRATRSKSLKASSMLLRPRIMR